MNFDEVKEGMILWSGLVSEITLFVIQKTSNRVAMIGVNTAQVFGTSKAQWPKSLFWKDMIIADNYQPAVIIACFEKGDFRNTLKEYWDM